MTVSPRFSPRVATPDSVVIKAQRMGFTFGEDVPQYWFDNDPFLTHFMQVLSCLFPEGEQFFVDAVRHYRKQLEADGQPIKAISGFIGQEAMHTLEHESLNQMMARRGLPAVDLDRFTRGLLALGRRVLTARQQLAVTCALEHITAMLADMLLERSDVTPHMHETMRPLWMWHAVEETEHKGVAFDVYEAAGGTYVERVGTQVVATVILAAVVAAWMARFMAADGSWRNVRSIGGGIWRLFGYRGYISSLAFEYLRFFRPGFHPWQKDNSELVARFKVRILELAAPEYRKAA